MTEQKTTYRVTGMTCGGCSSSMSSAIKRAVPGLSNTVSHEDDTVVVHGSHDPAAIKKAVTDAGFDFGGEVG